MGRAALFTRRGYSAPRHVPASRRSAGLTDTSRRAYVGSSGATVALPLRPSAERLVLQARRSLPVHPSLAPTLLRLFHPPHCLSWYATPTHRRTTCTWP